MAKKYLVKGGVPLFGEVEIFGYKNSAAPILSAVLLTEEEMIIDNLSLCSDVVNQIEILKQMGAKIEWLGERKIKVVSRNIDPEKIPFDLFEKMRMSVLLMAPLLARFKKIRVPHPGGDKIGLRPITTHLEAFKDFGIKVVEKGGFYYLEAPKKIEGKRVVLKEFSVTATENVMMLASLASGKTKIEIAAAEPQVQDLGEMLKKMGVKIKGHGTHTIEIEGERRLRGTTFSISPDCLEVGTFLIAFALTRGKGTIRNVNADHLTMFLKKMEEIGINFRVGKNEIEVFPTKKLRATKIQVLPYPGFPTDLQPQTSVILTQAEGKSLIHEPLYENRFQHLHELRKMGADIEITDPHRALIFGRKKLFANKLNGTDIRSGAALVLASLCAKGESVIEGVEQIERGYENFHLKLKKLGAKIEILENKEK